MFCDNNFTKKEDCVSFPPPFFVLTLMNVYGNMCATKVSSLCQPQEPRGQRSELIRAGLPC